jgi:hypothetical protein
MIKDKILSVPPFETVIYHWCHSKCGLPSHCLVRLYEHPDSGFFVVTSELCTNKTIGDRGYGKINDLGDDFVNLANAIRNSFKGSEKLSELCPSEIRWFQHYGSFSSYEGTGTDTFLEIKLMDERIQVVSNEYFEGDLCLQEEGEISKEIKFLNMSDVELILEQKPRKVSDSREDRSKCDSVETSLSTAS